MDFIMIAILIPFLLAMLASTPAAQKTPAPAPAATRAAQEEDIREALFRYQFSAEPLVFEYHFISIEGKSPSKTFLERFNEDTPEVAPISDAEKTKKPIRMIVGKKDQKQGVIFDQGAIKWISDTKVDIDGHSECGDTCDERAGTYHLSKQGDRWVVTAVDYTSGKPGS
jgi:hypothetical protein